MTDRPIWFSRRKALALAATGILAPAFARDRIGTAHAQEGNAMRLRLTFADQDFTATLEDSPSARDLFSMLPLDLTIADYSTNEKIAYLPRKLTEEGSGPFGNEAVGDLCYFAPWGNLAMFHGPYSWSRGLIRLGRLDGGPAPLLVRGEFPLRIEAPADTDYLPSNARRTANELEPGTCKRRRASGCARYWPPQPAQADRSGCRSHRRSFVFQ